MERGAESRVANVMTIRIAILIILLLVFLAVVLPFILGMIGVNVLPFGSVSGDIIGTSGLIRSSDGGTTWKNAAVSTARVSFPGKILDITFHPVNPEVMFLGTRSSGLWKSVDTGMSWTKTFDVHRVLSSTADVYRVGVSHASTTIIYTAVFQNRRGRVLKSDDSGASFREVYFMPTDGYAVTDLAINPHDADHVRIVSLQGGMIESRDGGRTWRVIKWFTEGLTSLFVNPEFFDEEFVRTARGRLWKTFDGGENWVELGAEGNIFGSSLEDPSVSEHEHTIHVEPFRYHGFSGFTKPSIQVLTMDPSNFARLYVGATNGLFRSVDGGFTWNELPVLIPPDALPVTAVAVHQGNPQIVFVGARNQLHWSTDGGTKWTVETLPTASRILRLAIHPMKPEVMFGILGR